MLRDRLERFSKTPPAHASRWHPPLWLPSGLSLALLAALTIKFFRKLTRHPEHRRDGEAD